MAKNSKILDELINTGKRLEQNGLIIGEGGNISARVGNVIYIKRRVVSLGKANINDYIPIDVKTGRPVRKNDKPSTEIYMHLECYKVRKDVKAVIHTHPVFATALGIANVDVGALSYEIAVNLKSHIALIGYVRPGTVELGRRVGRAIAEQNAILLSNHGLVTVGENLEEAFLRAIAIERAALSYICCKILGKVEFLRKEEFSAFTRRR